MYSPINVYYPKNGVQPHTSGCNRPPAWSQRQRGWPPPRCWLARRRPWSALAVRCCRRARCVGAQAGGRVRSPPRPRGARPRARECGFAAARAGGATAQKSTGTTCIEVRTCAEVFHAAAAAPHQSFLCGRVSGMRFRGDGEVLCCSPVIEALRARLWPGDGACASARGTHEACD